MKLRKAQNPLQMLTVGYTRNNKMKLHLISLLGLAALSFTQADENSECNTSGASPLRKHVEEVMKDLVDPNRHDPFCRTHSKCTKIGKSPGAVFALCGNIDVKCEVIVDWAQTIIDDCPGSGEGEGRVGGIYHGQGPFGEVLLKIFRNE